VRRHWLLLRRTVDLVRLHVRWIHASLVIWVVTSLVDDFRHGMLLVHAFLEGLLTLREGSLCVSNRKVGIHLLVFQWLFVLTSIADIVYIVRLLLFPYVIEAFLRNNSLGRPYL